MLSKFNFFNNNKIYVYVIVAYLALFYLLLTSYKNLEPYENRLKAVLLNKAVSMVDDTSSKILDSIVDKNKNFIKTNVFDEKLRLQNKKLLSYMNSTDISSLFVLYLYEGKYFFLLDTDEKEFSTLHEVFVPENEKIYEQVVKKKQKKVFLQSEVEGLAFTLLKPIVQNGTTVALLVIDYKENHFTALLELTIQSFRYFLIILLTLLFIFLVYVINTHYNKYKVYINPETNTLNRIYMTDNYAAIDFKKYYVALADIDFFKRINNRYGQNNGDKVITEVIKIMSKHLGSNDKFIQYSGEEFLLLIAKESKSEKNLRKLLEAIRISVHSTSFEIDNEKFTMSISMGVLLNTEIEKSLQDVIHKTDTALYEAKHNGRDIVCYYDISQPKRLYREKLKEMIESDKLVCYYQPIRDLETKELHHYEALLRIEDGDNIIFPDKILPDLEDSYLYVNLTKRVIEYNIKKLRTDKKMSISVNLSADDLVNDSILSILAQNADLADRLLIEILENKSIDYKRVEFSIQKLKNFGYKICIDDFGSGYSNLNHLLKLSIDYLKIDGSIIKEINHDKRAYSLVKTFATFCKQNNIEVIAEFIDKQDTVDILKSFGVTFGQGWYFSKAVPYEDLDKDHK